MSEKKIDRRVRYTKMVLRESLLELMKTKPVVKITTTELCKHADINRNTFYTHFDSPEQLLNSIEEEFFKEIKCSIVRLLKNGSIIDLLTEICVFISKNIDICSVLFSEYGDKEFLKRIFDLAYERSLNEWRLAGMKNDVGLKADYLYCFCLNGSIAVIQKWIAEGLKMTPKEVALLLHKYNYNGLNGFFKID